MSGRPVRIGVDLGGTKIESIALGGAGEVRARRRVATPRDDYDATVETIRDLVAAMEADCGVPPRSATVGVATPGAISPATRRMKNANSVWLNDRALDSDLALALGRAVRLANDANCLAVSEAIDGAAAGARVVFGVILGTGVGGGIALDGRAWVGPNAIAGEWGHNPLPAPEDVERPGPTCYCGRRGCIETFLSGPGLARDHDGGSIPAEAIAARALRGDAPARAALERHGERLARALATVVNLLDPEVIVLGGGLSRLEGLTARVTSAWGRHIFSDRVSTRLVLAQHGDASGVRGAAWLWNDEPRGIS